MQLLSMRKEKWVEIFDVRYTKLRMYEREKEFEKGDQSDSSIGDIGRY